MLRRLLPCLVVWIAACGDDDPAASPSRDAGVTGGAGAMGTGAAHTGAAAGSGGSEASGGAPVATGGTDASGGSGAVAGSGGRAPASGGAGGLGGTGGAALADSGRPDAGDVRVPRDASADATADGALPGCSGATDAVCVDYPGTFAVFLDADHEEVHSGAAPIEWVVAPGGSVLSWSFMGLAWILDVPAGLVLREPDVVVPPPPLKYQDIRIDVPEPPVATTVLSAAGCQTTGGAGVGVGAGIVTFDMDQTCLQDGKATVFVHAGGYYILVEDVEVGADSEPPLAVALGSWQATGPLGPGPAMIVDDIPPGFVAQVTHRALWGESGLLTGGTVGLAIASGSATGHVPQPTGMGSDWLRFLQIGEGTVNGDRWTVAYDSIGQPPAAETLSVTDDLMPMAENVSASGPTLSWSYPSSAPLAAADWVVLSVGGSGPEGADTLQIIAPPDTTTVTFPSALPGEYAGKALSTITRANIVVEDHPTADGYEEKLRDGRRHLQFPGNVTDPLGRQGRTLWEP